MDAVSQLTEILAAGGPYAVTALFACGWWLERRDRREKESHLHGMHERIVTLVKEWAQESARHEAAIKSLKDAIHAMNGRIR